MRAAARTRLVPAPSASPAPPPPGPQLRVAPGVDLRDALIEGLGHTVRLGADVRVGGQVALVAHDGDVEVRANARLGVRAVLVGPCVIGEGAVVAPGAVVTGEVPARVEVAGNPARAVRRRGGLPPAVDLETDVGRLFAHAGDLTITPVLREHRRMPDADLALARELAPAGSAVVDVGANIGYSTLGLAHAVGPSGRVIAVEPHPDNLWLLRANVARNGLEHVDVVAGAALDRAGEVELAHSDENTGDQRVGAVDGRPTLTVPAVRLDDVVPADLDVRLVALDTQGTEHLALAGARELLARCRPVVLLEFWPAELRRRGEDPVAVLRGLRALGYRASVVELPEAPQDDEGLVRAVADRPSPVGGFATLRLDPA